MSRSEGPSTPWSAASVEFAPSSGLPALGDLGDDPALRHAFLLRAQHSIAWEEPDSLWRTLPSSVAEVWPLLPDSTRALALEVLGKLGRGDLLEVIDDDPAGVPAHLRLRYLSEVGVERSFPMGGELTPLGAIYMARCAPHEDLELYLDSPYWAVRYTVCERADPTLVLPLMDDPVACVALQAALRRSEAGFRDGGEEVARLAASTPGPVGHLAARALGAEDSLLLLELMRNVEPGRRVAAQETWLEAGLPVDSSLAQRWERDPYWLIPVIWVHYLESAGELGRSRAAAERIAQRADSVDRPRRLLSFLEEIVTGGPAGVEAENGKSEASELPFDPDTVHGPPQAIIRTDEGDLKVALLWDVAPIACSGFVHLAQKDFYDGVYFHRVVPGFVVQAGCPQGNGMGGPGYTLPNERSLVHFGRGMVGMADAGLNTAGSQFFIMLDSHGRLDTRYTAFGRLTEGYDVLDRICIGTRIIDVLL
jgi:cyclophilin family peptidyl-prolyl cis-trans isomerase